MRNEIKQLLLENLEMLEDIAKSSQETLQLIDLEVKKYKEIAQTKLSDVREKLGDKIKTKEIIEHAGQSRREDKWL